MLTVLLIVGSLHAEWPPILPEVWAFREDPDKVIRGAVILENRTAFSRTHMDRLIRIRVLSEVGRDAVKLADFSDDCIDIQGRTVHPDGKVIQFDKRQDFFREPVSLGDRTTSTTALFPPGVTRDCVVEVRWREKVGVWTGRPIPLRMGHQAVLPFGSSYPTMSESIEVPKNFRWPTSLVFSTNIKLDITETQEAKIVSAKQIPALEQAPYALGGSLDRPIFLAWYQPTSTFPKAGEGAAVFWNGVGMEIWKPYFEHKVLKGKKYGQLKETILKRLAQKAPQDAAIELANWIGKEFQNLSQLTHAEAALNGTDRSTSSSIDLESICASKAANAKGLLLLYFHLLLDAGYFPKIALLADRDQWIFRHALLNPWQLIHPMIVLEEDGKVPLIVNPCLRFAKPGIILPMFQGVHGLLIDPKAEWTARSFQVPIQSAEYNQKRLDYELTLDDAEDRFKISAQFSGYPEFHERCQYARNEIAEQNSQLRKAFEGQLKGGRVLSAEVFNARDSEKQFTWELQAAVEREPSRRRTVDPFPGLPIPMRIPDSFPRGRSIGIAMPYLQVQEFRSTFRIPDGARLEEPVMMANKNNFGQVSWGIITKPDGQSLIATVTMVIAVNSMFAPSSDQESLKTFLGWVLEARNKAVILEKT